MSLLKVWMDRQTDKQMNNMTNRYKLMITIPMDPKGEGVKIKFNSIQIGNKIVEATIHAKNLGIIFDKEMNLKTFINCIYKSGF